MFPQEQLIPVIDKSTASHFCYGTNENVVVLKTKTRVRS